MPHCCVAYVLAPYDAARLRAATHLVLCPRGMPGKGTARQGTGGTMCGFTSVDGAAAGVAGASNPGGGTGVVAAAAGITAGAGCAGALDDLARRSSCCFS